ncbi:MAG: glycosyltransferase [Termitinemataceae bacterium]|nr:MAG: glycosyltransferase [Termitinemataceae bacterium]
MKVALVHYWLTSMRGGEQFLQCILEMFPEADIFTHVYNPKKISPKINSHKITCSRINRLPFARRLYKIYMPLMPSALLAFDLQKYDLVISSEAGPAKGVVCNPDAYHLCYCHSPMRYLWDMYHEYLKSTNAIVRIFMKALIPKLRIWDVTSANLVDQFITNSNYVAKRIKRYYRRDAKVVFGPADIETYLSLERSPKDFYLFLGKLAENKGIDIALQAFSQSGKKLIVAGEGSKKLFAKYKKCANIKRLGHVSENEKQNLFREAAALIFPGIEDMGLIPIEANAAACPVIAYKKGGVMDTLLENKTCIFFEEQTPAALNTAIEYFESCKEKFDDRTVFTNHVQQFSKAAFKDRIIKIIKEHKNE